MKVFRKYRFQISCLTALTMLTLSILGMIGQFNLYLEPEIIRSPFVTSHLIMIFAVFLIGISFLYFCLKHDPRKTFIYAGFGFYLITITLIGIEFLLGFFLPSWPAIGLHAAQIHSSEFRSGDSDAAVNSWGQVDRERNIEKEAGTVRYIFVGDSFLEDIPGAQISSLVENHLQDKIQGQQIEVINLGISATAPDEYYWRLNNVGLDMSPDHCVMFYFTDNDLLAAPSLGTWGGIAAPYPRSSLLSRLGLLHINHTLTYQLRPYFRAWYGAQDLAELETGIWDQVRAISDEDLPAYLTTMLRSGNSNQAGELEDLLHQRDLTQFYSILRDPPEGRFRSSYLRLALNFAVDGGQVWPLTDIADREALTLNYILGARDICLQNDAEFKLIVIPGALAVDPAFRDFYASIADIGLFFDKFRHAGQRIAEQVRREGVAVLDLTDTLDGLAGNYLLVDGHWTREGAQIVAESMSRFLVTN